MPVRQLDAVLSEQASSLEAELTTKGIFRVDVYVDGRPVLSQNVTDGTTKIRIDTPSTSAQLLEIVGIDTNEVVAIRKVILKAMWSVFPSIVIDLENIILKFIKAL